MGYSLKKFRDRYDVGRKYEEYVYDLLLDEGIPVTLSDYTPPKPGVNAREFTKESTDIIVGDDIIIEVKSRGGTCADFTSPADFPYKTVIVDTVYGWEQKDKKPDYYVFVSQNKRGIMVLGQDTHWTWGKESIYDRYEGKKNLSYVAYLDYVQTWENLVEVLRERTKSIHSQSGNGGDGGELVPGESETSGD